MRKRLLLFLGVAVLLAVGGLGAVLLWPRDDGPVSRARCERVQVGMTRAEVETVLGGPPGDYTTGEMDNVRVSFHIATDPPVRHEWWQGDGGTLWVEFDGQDRVVAHNFSPDRRLTFINKVRRWLGF